MFKAFSSSLSLRLLGIFIVTAILVIVLLISVFSRGLSGQWRRTIQPHLVQYLQYVQEDLGSPPRPEKALALSERLPVDIYIYHGETLHFSTNSKALDLTNSVFRPVNRRLQNKLSNNTDQAAYQAFVSMQRSPGDRLLRIDTDQYSVYYDLHETRVAANQRYHRGGLSNELLIALLLLAIILGASYLLIRRQLSPIRQIQASVGRMANAELDHRIGRAGSGDLDVLSQSIDGMAERLQNLLDAKRQLLVAVSHELRSPITRARLNTELLPPSRQQERLLEDLNDMQRMITDIMEAEQLQSNHSVLNLAEVDLVALLDDELQQLPKTCKLTTNLNTKEPYLLMADAARLRILLRNIVTNAMQHGQVDGNESGVTVELHANLQSAEIVVSDQGPGISPDHLNVIADPLYRPDPSRSRNTGGFGLGLTLASRIAEAHDGSLTIDSDPNTRPGTRVHVHLPKQPNESRP